MDVLILIGRILFAAVFAGSSIAHLTKSDQMGGYAESRGVKPGKPLVLLTGVQMLVGSLLLILGIYADLGALLLALFAFSAAFLMHAFWKDTDPQTQQTEQIQFMKDLSLGGGAIALFAFFAGTDVGLTITDSLFSFS